MSVAITEVVTLELEDWSGGGGAGGPLESPARAKELLTQSTHTSAAALKTFVIFPPVSANRKSLTYRLLVPTS